MDEFDYQHWLAVARRYSRRRSEAPDLLHDALLDSIRAGKTDFARDSTRRWFAGVIRNRAAMTARTAARRSRREKRHAIEQRGLKGAPSRSFIDSLSPSARSVATLVVAGLNRDEIMVALNIAPTAFRQRLTAIRRAWRTLPADLRELDAARDADTSDLADLGLIRRALIAQVRCAGGVGTHDPDGHLIILESTGSHLAAARQQKIRQRKD